MKKTITLLLTLCLLLCLLPTEAVAYLGDIQTCLLYTSPSPRD